MHYQIGPPDDPSEFKKAIMYLMNELKCGRTVLPSENKLQRFKREHIALQLAEILTSKVSAL